MPAYVFELVSGDRTVLAVTITLPVESRDKLTIRRRSVPERVAVSGSARSILSRNSVLAGYHAMERRHGSRFRSQFTPRQIKEAWSA